MQNWGQDTCKVLEGVLKSQIRYGREDFLGATAYFVLGAVTSKIEASAESPMQTQTPTNLFCRESPPSDSTSRGAQRQGQTQKHQCPCIESFRKQSSPQPCPEPLPQRRRMRQCKPMSNTAPQASCSQGYHGPCTARSNPQRYLFRLLGYSHPFLGEGSALLPQIRGRWNLCNNSQCVRHRQLLGTGMVSPTYVYAAPSSHQGAADNHRNTRDTRKKNPNIPIRTALRRIPPSNETANY